MQKFSDPLDAANEQVEEFNQRAIDNVLRNGGQEVLPFKGCCYNCLDPLEKPRRFCDEFCIEDWEWREAAKKRNGS